jgi:hypothetical protein
MSVHPELDAALTPVLHDLRTCGVQPILEPWEDRNAGMEGVWLKEPDGTGAVVAVTVGAAHIDQMVRLADGAQEWAVEALNAAALPATWPECPRHPNSHPLQPGITGQRATWSCPRDSTVVAAIGDLPIPTLRGASP